MEIAQINLYEKYGKPVETEAKKYWQKPWFRWTVFGVALLVVLKILF
jgi:hypothetical protein